MKTIGVYDSGIGGITVLKEILKNFAGNAIYYFADNLHSPLGALNDDELGEVLSEGLARVQANSDVTVIACNTASTFLNLLSQTSKSACKSQNNAFIATKCADNPRIKPIVGILPPIYPDDVGWTPALFSPSKTLLIATDGTKRRISLPEGMLVADTPELATLIERAFDDGGDMSSLLPYLREKLERFAGVRRVILGCTHYPFCKKEIASVLGRTRFADGTPALISALKNFAEPRPEFAAPIKFAFSGRDESEKYSRILEIAVNGK